MLPEFACRRTRTVTVQEPIDVHVPRRQRLARLTRHRHEVMHRRPRLDRGHRLMRRIVDIRRRRRLQLLRRPPTSPRPRLRQRRAVVIRIRDARVVPVHRRRVGQPMQRQVEVSRLHRVMRERRRRDRRVRTASRHAVAPTYGLPDVPAPLPPEQDHRSGEDQPVDGSGCPPTAPARQAASVGLDRVTQPRHPHRVMTRIDRHSGSEPNTHTDHRSSPGSHNP